MPRREVSRTMVRTTDEAAKARRHREIGAPSGRPGTTAAARVRTRRAAPTPTSQADAGGPPQITRCSRSEIMASARERSRCARRCPGERLSRVRHEPQRAQARSGLVDNQRSRPQESSEHHGRDVAPRRDGAPAERRERGDDRGCQEPEHVGSRPDAESGGDPEDQGGRHRSTPKVIRECERGHSHGRHPDRHAAIVEDREIQIGRMHRKQGSDDQAGRRADLRADQRDEAGDSQAGEQNAGESGDLGADAEDREQRQGDVCLRGSDVRNDHERPALAADGDPRGRFVHERRRRRCRRGDRPRTRCRAPRPSRSRPAPR